MKKQNKHGISLVILSITIIVMIILASTIIISLSDTDMINKAQEAVNTTNLKQVESLAKTLWIKARSLGSRSQVDLENAVLSGLIENDIDVTQYTITVTIDGVTVEEK